MSFNIFSCPARPWTGGVLQHWLRQQGTTTSYTNINHVKIPLQPQMTATNVLPLTTTTRISTTYNKRTSPYHVQGQEHNYTPYINKSLSENIFVKQHQKQTAKPTDQFLRQYCTTSIFILYNVYIQPHVKFSYFRFLDFIVNITCKWKHTLCLGSGYQAVEAWFSLVGAHVVGISWEYLL